MFVIELNKLNSNKVAAHAPSTIKSQLEGFEEVMKLVANSVVTSQEVLPRAGGKYVWSR